MALGNGPRVGPIRDLERRLLVSLRELLRQLIMNSWSRTRFESLPRRELSRGSHWKPSVWRVEDGEEIFAVKDASTVPAATRWFARWMMRRELRALRRVRGIPGVPQLLAEFGGDGYACTWLAGDVLDGPGFAQRPTGHGGGNEH